MVKGLGDLASDQFYEAAVTTSPELVRQAIYEAYNNTLDPQEVLRGAIKHHAQALLREDEVMFDQILEETPAFAADLAKAMAKREPKWYGCPCGCRTTFCIVIVDDEEFAMHCDRQYKMTGKEWEKYVTTEPQK